MTPEEAYWKARRPRRTRELEYIVLADPLYACLYAKDIIEGRWKKAEDIIATDPESAVCYAIHTIKGRFKKAEKVIADDSLYNEVYIENIFDNKPPIDYAVKSSYNLYIYAKNVIKGKLPTELHNRMLCFAIVEPNARHIKTYFKSKKYQ